MRNLYMCLNRLYQIVFCGLNACINSPDNLYALSTCIEQISVIEPLS